MNLTDQFDPNLLSTEWPNNEITIPNHISEQDGQINGDATLEVWNAQNDFYCFPAYHNDGGWPRWAGDGGSGTPEMQPLPPLTGYGHEIIPSSEVTGYIETNHGLETVDPDSLLAQGAFTSVPQWLDGAYYPPTPCSYCCKHRLQCLIIRTTSANPNPVTSCSSCVALFRECSLAQGEKRRPSGFETMSLALGHLHGVTEQGEDGGHVRDTVVAGNNNATEDGGEQRKESKQFVRNGARILRNWFYQNQEFPYPSEEQKAQLSRETGFSEKRVSIWFANARRRHKQRFNSTSTPSRKIVRTGSPMPSSTLADLSPMERWQSSPPEDEPILESEIRNAIASTSTEQGDNPGVDISWSGASSAADPSLFHGGIAAHIPSSVSSLESKVSEVSSASSASTAWSYRSLGDETPPFPLLPSRKRSGRTTRGKQRRSGAGSKQQFQCTFCTQSFKKKHDWSRHETSVHLPLDRWVCIPDLNELQSLANHIDLGQMECRFCDTTTPFPTHSHFQEHEFHICAGKPVAERSFTRKDYLWQHLRKFHSCTKLPVSDLDAWRDDSRGNNVRSRCGFCGSLLASWKERAGHLAMHFKEGCRMEQWEGDWGLSPPTLSVLRNSILPSRRDL